MTTGYFFINLDREEERRALMLDSASMLGLQFYRISAVDVRTLDQTQTRNVKAPRYSNARWMLRPLEIAVFESHRKVWEAFMASGHDVCVVMEDDLLFSADFPMVVSILERNTDRFDIARINHASQTRLMGRAVDIGSGLSLRPILENMADAGCYALSRKAARSLLRQSDSYSGHVDDFSFSPDRRLRTVQVFPPACGQIIHMPTAAHPDGITISARYEQTDILPKGPRAFRVWKELRRLWKKLVTNLRAKLAGGERVNMHALLTKFTPMKPRR